MSEHSLDSIFYPKSIAIVGASDNPKNFGYDFLRFSIDNGFKGPIYPVNPKRSELMGLKAYPRLADIPGSVDYVKVCLKLSLVPDLLTECSKKGVKGVHLLANADGAVGSKEKIELENEILQRAKNYNIRIIGPNCMGIYSPDVGVSMGHDYPSTSGSVSALIQSGGITTNLIRWASLRGIRFSKVVSYGNGLDLNEADFLNYYANDHRTKLILCYIEGVKDGRKFFQALRNAANQKPVIIVKSGTSEAGLRAIASHTGSLASAGHVWDTVVTQAGAIPARDVEEMIDIALPFALLPPIKGRNIGIEGPSGGISAVAADACEKMGFDIIPLPSEVIDTARSIDPANAEKLTNPSDYSNLFASPLWHNAVSLMAKNSNFDFVIGITIEDAPWHEERHIETISKELESWTDLAKEGCRKLVVVVGDRSLGISEMDNWRWKLYAQVKTELVKAGIPFFSNIHKAAKAMKEFVNYCADASLDE